MRATLPSGLLLRAMSVDDLVNGNCQQDHEHRDEHEIEQQHDDASSTCRSRLCPRTNSSARYKSLVPRKAPHLTPLKPGGRRGDWVRPAPSLTREALSAYRSVAFGQCRTGNPRES